MVKIFSNIPRKVQAPLAFIGGALCMLIWSSMTGTGATANLSESQLDARSNGVISTQREEITRLRRIIQESNCSEAAAPVNTNQATTGGVSCTTHNDCPGIDVVCQNSFCKELNDPACACQTGANGDYVLCISDQGAGAQARTTSCGDGVCNPLPEPNCAAGA